MNSSQIKGIAIIILALVAYFLVDSDLIHTLAGILCAVGLGLVLKWIPLKKVKA